MMNEKLLFKIGSKIDICGASGSGKTYWLVNYLTKVDDRFDSIIWITNQLSAEQELIKELKKKLGNKFVLKVGLTENQDELTEMFKDNKDDKIKTAVILDDLQMEQGKWTSELFLAGRHLNLTIFQIVQSIFTGNKQARNMTNNVQYFVLFQFPDVLSVAEKARRLTTNKIDRNQVVEAYKNAISKQGGCLIIDTITSQSGLEDAELLRFRDTEMDLVYKNLSKV
jgi:type II secretory pathway predicted ATPase ExeA